jgi:hypothetical protein
LVLPWRPFSDVSVRVKDQLAETYFYLQPIRH